MQLNTALTRLSTGLKINSGADDPAGLIAAQNLGSRTSSASNAGISNSQQANSVIATADSALSQVSSLLDNIRGLVSQSANTGALSQTQIAANQLQVDSSLQAIDRIANSTTFGGQKLLDGSLNFITTSAGTSQITAATGTIGAVAATATATVGTGTSAVSVTAKTAGAQRQMDSTCKSPAVSRHGVGQPVAFSASRPASGNYRDGRLRSPNRG